MKKVRFTKRSLKIGFLWLLLVLVNPTCAHLNDTCDSYCIRHGGQCAGVDYGTRIYNATTGEYKDKPTFFKCKFIN